MKNDILKQVQDAQCYSIMIDETTDVTTKEQMIIYGKYMAERQIKTSFLGIIEVRLVA